MLDVSRHFFDVACVKKFIDAMALHKLNRFHWHLTDDQVTTHLPAPAFSSTPLPHLLSPLPSAPKCLGLRNPAIRLHENANMKYTNFCMGTPTSLSI